MNSSILLLTLLSIAAPPVETSATPTTRLYVRTTPPGAEVRLDGKPAGKSDDLFVVPAGVQKMTIDVELDGHYPRRKEVQIRGGQITRVELQMLRRTVAESTKPAVAAKPDSPVAATPTLENHQGVVIGVAVRLDFRIAATRGGGKSGLTEAEVAQYKKEEPEKSRGSGRPYAWFVELPGRESTNLIEWDYMGHRYVLLSNLPEETMLAVGSWGLKEVAAGMDSHGQPCLSVELNDAGSRQMESLSRANVGRPLAIVLNDVVTSAPLLRSKITNRAEITGKFTEAEVKQLADQMRPSPAALNVHDLPQETLQQLLQQLPYHVEEPWMWDELQRRQKAGSLSPKYVDDAVKILIAHMTAKRPEGWGQPLTWQSGFLSAATKAGMISPPVLLDLCDAVNGPKPVIRPLPRWREGKENLQVHFMYGDPWDSQNQACLGVQLLWQVERLLLDDRLIEVLQPQRSGCYWWGSCPGALKAGDHRIVVEVQCAYVDSGKMIGLNAADLPTDRWPEARKRWKQAVSAPLKVYTASEPIVSLVTDASRSPGPSGAIGIDRFVVQADRDGKKKIVLKVVFTPGQSPSLPLSYDVSAAIEGSPNRINLGPMWIVRSGNTTTSSGDQAAAIIDGLDPSIRQADIILTPNPGHVEQFPGVSEIWGKKVILHAIPLERLDLKAKAASSQ